jgi:putative tryptophan/tyrosine transport system substrate-binding protein
MKRRDFIALLGGAAAWPLAARAQQPALPVVGFLANGPADAYAEELAGFRKGLADLGYIEGRNVMIEYRWFEGRYDRLPEMAANLVRHPLAVIVAVGPPAVRAAQSETTTIPIVFGMGEDPVKEGLVTSLNRPHGNTTGITTLANQLFAKRLQLLHEIVPKAAVLGLLVNPANPNAEPDTEDAQSASAALGHELRVLPADSERDFEAVFASMVQQRIGGLLVGVDNMFHAKRALIAALAVRHAIPTMFDRRGYTDAGGLMSYGANYFDERRQVGVYVGRILRGARPADLPVQQATHLEFVLNLNTAKALGLDIPPGVLAIVDEVIE